MSMQEPILSAQNVVKRYGGLTALDGVTLDIAAGEFFGLIGPNGAGKSTFMSLVSGLKGLDSGTLTVSREPVGTSALARASLGLVPQHIALYEDLSAEANLRIFGALYGLRGRELSARVDDLLCAVQLSDRRGDLVRTFSGGMQRRLNLAAALLHKPKLLLCDEPTVGVDPQSRNAIFEFLKDLNRKGLTVIYSTHYMEEATRLCSRIGVIDHGRILALGTVEELLERLPFEDEIRFPASAGLEGFVRTLAEKGEVSTVDGVHRFRPRQGFHLSAFYALAESSGLPPRTFTHQRPTLEALFLELTGRSLRE
jgi:ABC-2 type transport system ATP-binding protein